MYNKTWWHGYDILQIKNLISSVVFCVEKYVQHASNNTTEFVCDEKRRQVIKSKPS